MDNDGFLFESLTITDAIDEINQQYGESTYGKEKYTVEEMHWIGYIYRYWSYSYELTSKQIYKIAKPEQMKIGQAPTCGRRQMSIQEIN